MKNKKGFTLIELLAVIVVLAVVALITVPTVLNVIEKVRKESYRDSIYGIMESGKIYLASHIDSISEKDEIEFTCDGDKCTSINDELSFKGSVPKSGSIYINGDGLIEIESLYNGKYYANGTNEEGIEITNDSPMTRSELEETILAMQAKYDKEINELKAQNSSQTAEINSLKAENNEIKNTTTNIKEVYPVGSIYITLSPVNPSTLFPDTTWEKYSEGKTLVGHDGTNYITDDATKGSGGSSTVKLTISNLPSHSHKYTPSGTNSYTTSNVTTGNESQGHSHSIPSLSGKAYDSGAHTHTVSTLSGNTLVGIGIGTSFTTDGSSWGFNDAFDGSNADGSSGKFYAISAGIHSHDVGTYGNTTGNISQNHTHTIASNNLKNAIGNITFNGTQSSTEECTNCSGTSFSVQNPYTVVYMWKRIS